MTSYWTKYRKNKAECEEFMELDCIDFSDSGKSELGATSCEIFDNKSHNPSDGSPSAYDDIIQSSVDGIDSSDESFISFSNDSNNCKKLQSDLRQWAIKHNCPRAWLNDLLVILRKNGHSTLPKDSRTLLQTPRKTISEQTCGGEFKYFGIENGIINELQMLSNIPKSIELKINIDGVPLWKSSPEQFWPILGRFHKSNVFLIAIYYGKTKPNNIDEFLDKVMNEISLLETKGLVVKKNTLNVTLQCFICDAPARAFLKSIILHSGYYSCERCCTKGSYDGRVVFNSREEFEPRTDEGFESYSYEKHQKAETPLVKAGIKCISKFPLDYMHLVCLGVTKRILKFLKEGPYCCKLSASQIQQISDHLVLFRGKLPSDFARQPRSLTEVKRWKATEFRQFLLYTGPVVLMDILKPDLYVHFLSLSMAMAILLNSHCEKRMHYLEYAKSLLLYFVTNCKKFYGPTFTVYNVHNLLHICDDVINHNCSLNDISAFPFENYLQTLKRMIRNSNNPIAQVSNRIHEIITSNFSPTIESNHCNVSTNCKDRCFSTGSKIAFIKCIKRNGDYVCDVTSFSKLENLFTEPLSSTELHIGYLKRKTNFRELILKKDDFVCKLVCLPHKDGYIIIPLIHDC